MRDMLAKRWNEIGERLVQLAEAVPESAYDARPAAEVRSFAEQLRHVAFWNQYTRDSLRGVSPDGETNELSRTTYSTKKKIVAALRTSFEEVASEIGKRGARVPDADADTIVSFIEHSGEHYGQCVIYARLASVVPPTSRPALESATA